MNIKRTLSPTTLDIRRGQIFNNIEDLPLYGISRSKWIRGDDTELAMSDNYAYSIKLITGTPYQDHIVTTSYPPPNTLLEVLCNAAIAQKVSGIIYYRDIVIPPFTFMGLLSTEQISVVRKYIAKNA